MGLINRDSFNTFYPKAKNDQGRNDKPNPIKVATRRRIEWLLEQQTAKAATGF